MPTFRTHNTKTVMPAIKIAHCIATGQWLLARIAPQSAVYSDQRPRPPLGQAEVLQEGSGFALRGQGPYFLLSTS